MAYSNGIFYIDYLLGSDTARAALASCIASNPSGTITRITKAGHGLITGAVVDLTLYTAWLNSAWKITKVDNDNFDLDGAVWVTTSDADGIVTPRGGSSWSDAWRTMTTGATAARHQAGDIVRVAKSPDPTDVGQTAQWFDNVRSGGGFSLTSGYGTITSSTNATPIKITKNSHGLSNGDVVLITGHTINTNANGWFIVSNVAANTFDLEGSVGNGSGGATGYYWRRNSMAVVLTTAVTTEIEKTYTNWTPGTNVTSANTWSGIKSRDNCIHIVTGASCGANQIIARKATASALDLSGYRQISFWIRPGTSALAAGDLLIKLYSDAACTAEVESFSVPAIPLAQYTIGLTIDKGAALYNGVMGIAVFATVSLASKTIDIEHFIACKDSAALDSISLTSLISKSSNANGGTEPWYAISSIQGRVIVIDQPCQYANHATLNINAGGYTGKSETVELYKRECLKTTIASGSTSDIHVCNSPGTASARITFSGGWDPVGNTQNGHTYFSGQGYCGNGLTGSGKPFITVERFSFVRFYNGVRNPGTDFIFWGDIVSFNAQTGVLINSRDATITILAASNNGRDNFNSGSTATTLTAIELSNSVATGLVMSSGNHHTVSVTNIRNNGGKGADLALLIYCTVRITNYSNNYSALYQGAMGLSGLMKIHVYLTTVKDNGYYAIGLMGLCVDTYIIGATFTGHTASVASGGILQGSCLNMIDCISSDAFPYAMWSSGGGDYETIFWKNGIAGVPGSYRIDGHNWMIQTDSLNRHTASGYALAFLMNGVKVPSNPYRFRFAKILCSAGTMVTASVWIKKSHATNPSARLVAIGGLLAGVPQNVYSSFKSNDTSWEQITVTFTPLEIGTMEFEIISNTVVSASTIYIDDFSIIQV